MKTLLIMRHAKSSWDNMYLGDHERPLNKRGKRDAVRMGELLRAEDLVPELIISSTAERARDTAERVAESSGYPHEMLFTRQFYHAAPEDYLRQLRKLEDDLDRVMVVGHNPGMAELVADLCAVDEHFTTANIAWVALPLNSWSQLTEETQGELRGLWRPKELV